jgi:hypothetical protein
MFVRRPITSSFLTRCVGSFGLAIPAPGLMTYLEELHLPVEAGRAVAHPRDAKAKAENVVVAPRQRLVQGQSAVNAEADEVAILQRREHRTDEGIDVAVGVLGTPDHLVRHPIDRIIAVMSRRHPVAGGAGKRHALVVILQVVEAIAVVPGADLVRAWERAFAVRFRRGARSGKRKLQRGVTAPVLRARESLSPRPGTRG